MEQTYSLKQKYYQLMKILFPILITQVLMCSMSFFATMMSGHASANDLVGVAIGASIWMPVFTGLNGILFATVPIVAQLLGAKRKEGIPFVVIQAIYLAVAIGAIVIICGIYIVPLILDGMELNSLTHEIAQNYLFAISVGVVPLFISTVCRCFIDTLGYTRVTMLVFMGTLPINIALDYVLIFGKLGFPTLGGVGAGVAAAVTYWCFAISSVCVILFRKPFRNYHVFSQFYPVAFSAWKEQLKVGVPIGSAIFCETSIFAIITLLMSQFSEATIAAYQVATNVASLIYMIPLSISMALTIAVGFEVGAKRHKDAKVYSYIGVAMALLLAVATAAVLFFWNEQVARLYTEDVNVLKIAQEFLLYAVFFQLSDAIATPVQGALRGYKDVRITFIMAMVSYWIVGLPLGFVLAHHSPLGAFGYWIGLIAGLAFGAICLSARLVRVQRKKLEVERC